MQHCLHCIILTYLASMVQFSTTSLSHAGDDPAFVTEHAIKNVAAGVPWPKRFQNHELLNVLAKNILLLSFIKNKKQHD